MKNILSKIKTYIKAKLIHEVSLEEIYPNLNKYNIVESEGIEILAEDKKTIFIETPRSYTTILNGVIYCPRYNILLTKDRKIISESFNTPRDKESFNLQTLFNLKTETISDHCMIFHQWTNNYYHTLLDNLPRFYLACHHPLVKESIETIYLIHSRNIFKYEQFFLEKLLPDNIIPTSLKEDKLYYLEKLIFSTFLSSKQGGYLPQVYREDIYSQFLPNRNRKKHNRIFISRIKAYNGRHILNEPELLDMLNDLGFRNFILESLTPSEQIELFYDAEAVVAPHGAGLTNLLFSEKVKVLELFPTQDFSLHYSLISQSMDHTYQHWNGKEKNRNSNFFVNVFQVKMLLEELLR